MRIAFEKMQGLGNDFIVIEDFTDALSLTKGQVIALCDRNFGIGADGIIILKPSTDDEADCGWWFANADGSMAEMCGNGIRCAARYLYDHEKVSPDATELRIATVGGVRTIEILTDEDGGFTAACVDMGSAEFAPEAIGTSLEPNTELAIEYISDNSEPAAATSTEHTETIDIEGIIDYPLAVEEVVEPIEVTCLSMGNPHTVIDVSSLGCSIATAPVAELGPPIEHHPAFAHRTNVVFVEVVDDETLNVRVWERGCGETLACGTGACAAAVSAFLHGQVGEDLTVQLPGGDLTIHIDPASLAVRMAGPAHLVYAGTVELDTDDER